MDSSAQLAQSPQPAGQPLAALLRDRIDGDGELRRMQNELKTHLMRAIEWWDSDRRHYAMQRLRKLSPGVPRLIRPADFTAERVAAAYETELRTSHLRDPWAAIWARRIEGRLSLVVAEVLDRLRSGKDVATTGRPANDPTATVAISKSLWNDPATTIDTLSGDLLIGGVPAFVAVVVSQPAPRAALSERAARRFLGKFADAMDDMARTFTSAEATEQIQRCFPGASMASEHQTTRLLREMRPSSWAHNGRRRAVAKPTADELVDAAAVARQVVETIP